MLAGLTAAATSLLLGWSRGQASSHLSLAFIRRLSTHAAVFEIPVSLFSALACTNCSAKVSRSWRLSAFFLTRGPLTSARRPHRVHRRNERNKRPSYGSVPRFIALRAACTRARACLCASAWLIGAELPGSRRTQEMEMNHERQIKRKARAHHILLNTEDVLRQGLLPLSYYLSLSLPPSSVSLHPTPPPPHPIPRRPNLCSLALPLAPLSAVLGQ